MFKQVKQAPFAILRVIDAQSNLPFISRAYSQQRKNIKVTVLGAAGGVGQPLSLLLKQIPVISRLALFDIQHVQGVAADLSHIDTRAVVEAHVGETGLEAALRGADIVMIPAGIPRKPGMTRDDLFKTNAQIVFNLIRGVAKFSPNTLICILTDPVNAIVPMAAEVLKHYGVYDPRRLFGVTTLDVVRANSFIAMTRGLDVTRVNVPVLGGHTAETIIPVFSQMTPTITVSNDERAELTRRVREAGTEVVEAKAGLGGATLASAYASWRFAKSLLQGIIGREGVVECAYVKSEGVDAEYFSSPLLLGKNGIESNFGIGNVTQHELELLHKALPVLRASIKKGEDFAHEMLGTSKREKQAVNN